MSPDLVVLGDSFAMGWGVNDSETFASLLKRRTGLKVLNTGVASYATAREKLTLSRVPLDNLKYVIIQYCPNDLRENQLFYLRNNVHRSRSKDDYDRVVKWYRENRGYYPGESVDLLVSHRIFGGLFARSRLRWPYISEWTPADRQARKEKPQQTDAELFVNAFVNAGVALPASLKKVLVFSNDEYSASDQKMISELEMMKAAHRLDAIPGEVVILKTSDFLNSTHYYRLDGHLNSAGHVAMANALAPHLPVRETR